jgi:integrase
MAKAEEQRTLNDATIKALPIPAKGAKFYVLSGRKIQGSTSPRGFGCRVTDKGTRSFALQYFTPAKHLIVIGEFPVWKPLQAVNRARELRQHIDSGGDPLADRKMKRDEERRAAEAAVAAEEAAAAAEEAARQAVRTTTKAILESYLEKACGVTRDADGMPVYTGSDRTARQRVSAFERLFYPKLGEIQIADLKRSKIAEVLDEVARANGPVMADRALAYLRKALNWYATRSDDFNNPILRGMSQTKPRSRKRILTDEEIRDLWTGDDFPHCFPRYVKTLLLTALRRKECSHGVWGEIEMVDRDNPDDTYYGLVWTVPARRMKNHLDFGVPLRPAVLEMLGNRAANIKTQPYLFSNDGGQTPFSGYSKAKAALDKVIAKLRQDSGRDPMPRWTLHDLRRTARSLMSRAGVPPDHAERCLSHVIGGVRGTYDRWAYLPQKKTALDKLADLMNRMIGSSAGNITGRTRRREISREELFAMVWERPSEAIAKELGISGVALGKLCVRLNVPKPPRGHWRKVQTGKTPGQRQRLRKRPADGPISFRRRPRSTTSPT